MVPDQDSLNFPRTHESMSDSLSESFAPELGSSFASPDSLISPADEDTGVFSGSALSRRRFLAATALGGAGLLLSSTSNLQASSLWSMPGVSRTSQALNIPKEWVDVLGRPLLEYATYLARLRLRNVTVRQIIEPHMNKRGDVQNTIPPRQLWPNIRKTLLLLDRVAMVLGEKVADVTSVYRSPAYNARCAGAASNSWHIRNNAVDVKFHSSPARVAEAARRLRERGLFAGGVGRYYGFTHLDTRGENVDW